MTRSEGVKSKGAGGYHSRDYCCRSNQIACSPPSALYAVGRDEDEPPRVSGLEREPVRLEAAAQVQRERERVAGISRRVVGEVAEAGVSRPRDEWSAMLSSFSENASCGHLEPAELDLDVVPQPPEVDPVRLPPLRDRAALRSPERERDLDVVAGVGTVGDLVFGGAQPPECELVGIAAAGSQDGCNAEASITCSMATPGPLPSPPGGTPRPRTETRRVEHVAVRVDLGFVEHAHEVTSRRAAAALP